MLTKVIGTVAALVISVGTALAAAPAALDQMQKEMFQHTAQLNENCSASMIYSKRDDVSGDVLTIFLTAKHCVNDRDDFDNFVDIPVYQNNRVIKKERYIARVRGLWYRGDLALVELKDKQTFFPKVAKIAAKDTELFLGEDVWTIGYPMGGVMTVTPGMFGSLETHNFDQPGVEYFRATPGIAGGSSGGGLYHRGKDGYELLGVTAARSRNDSFIGLYTTLYDIHDYLKNALPDALPKTDTDAKKEPVTK